MDENELKKLKTRLAKLRNQVANMTNAKLVSFAGALGRTRSKRGKEPTYISELLPYSLPISIPGHKKINKFTAGSILDAFEKDIEELEEILENQKKKNG
ncbi:MAG TPA: hypothetical protein VKF38_01675 [Anaerolineaceae bacterium]|nr:hypothetical protein [Anaerolineaceae bacterium]